MRHFSDEEITVALGRAHDAAGVAALLEALGYRLVAPPDGVLLEERAVALPLPLERRYVATGGGIESIVVLADQVPGAAVRGACIRALLAGSPRPVLLLWPADGTLTIASGGLDGRPRAMMLSTRSPRAAEIELLRELTAREEGTLAALSRHGRALDRSSLSRRFFRDFRAQRDVVSRAWIGLPEQPRADRDQLALLFLSRLLFLYFLQKQGHMLGRETYLVERIREAALASSDRSLFRRVLAPLFFGVLNRPVDARDADARSLGDLPYLNGGLFEAHALERAHPGLDLPDDATIGVFEDLLERYRFTAGESPRASGDLGATIQPEMLGRMFEELMAADRRGATGTFYTPAAVVDRIVRRSLQAWLAGRPGMDWRAAGMLLRERAAAYAAPGGERLLHDVRAVRVLDPACGSGAFVLGALERLTRLRRALGDATEAPALRRDLAARALHGVDVEADAALLCALRLWLALSPGKRAPAAASGAPESPAVQPLPNLDHRVRQGDALLDPLELAARGDASAEVWKAAALDRGVRRARALLAALAAGYASADADRRVALRARLRRAELRLARRWIDAALRRLEASRREVAASRRTRDLFGRRPADRAARRGEVARLHAARSELRALARRLRDRDALPFFSFAVHFVACDSATSASWDRIRTPSETGGAGFDLVVSNPPWVRSHRWPRAFTSLVRARYRVCADPGWRAPSARSRTAAPGQVDLALLFVERGIELLAQGGVLGILLPSKSFRSLSAGGARAIVDERMAMLVLEDHSLNHRAIFRADAFAGVLVARVRTAQAGRAETQGEVATAQAPRVGAVVRTDRVVAPEVVRVTMTHRVSRPLRFLTPAAELALDAADARSPWMIVPPPIRCALRRMQCAGAPLGADARLGVRRGVMTGANDVLVFDRAERKLGDAVVAWPARSHEATPARSILLAVTDLCPLVRGAGIRPFRFDADRFVAWTHDDETTETREPSRRLTRYLGASRKRLRARPGWREGMPDGALFRLDSAMLRPRVAWRDIASDLETVFLPARTRTLGTMRPLVALNTVYFIAVDDERVAHGLAALLSSLPARVFARAIAERAKDARFRFLAWTVATIPLPRGWDGAPAIDRLAALSVEAHAAAAAEGSLDGLRAEIDAEAFALYGLDERSARAMRAFDRWLGGIRPEGGSAS